jgi:hypothetical protein
MAAKKREEIPSKKKKPALRYWEVAQQLAAQVPEEEWAKLPTDMSINYRHYLYGHPKAE